MVKLIQIARKGLTALETGASRGEQEWGEVPQRASHVPIIAIITVILLSTDVTVKLTSATVMSVCVRKSNPRLSLCVSNSTAIPAKSAFHLRLVANLTIVNV